ncbi:hypothetical protein BU14_0077s0005 [Porphyra umbilicalis]|uniref:Asparaginase n=1 Tax=Porphyra umbilicalis TaxID=2786 RepID=A0A1X6PF64_PORUM|nr:hypothetical protein BU14_0077s0005 [Porphyra umbilicalis]|eukprot:OSX79385.1 hypothetical protein BU14_0077s0005 [Porphyra umbilicalis]
MSPPTPGPPVSTAVSPPSAAAAPPLNTAIDGRTMDPGGSTQPRLVAVHAGAGRHGLKEEHHVCEAMRAAMAAAAAAGGSAAAAATAAVAALEASGVVNAGPNGGSLTWDGSPEADACVVTPTTYGAVGAVAGLVSAVTAAAAVVDAQGEGGRGGDTAAEVAGLVAPGMLAGTGAAAYAARIGLPAAGAGVGAGRQAQWRRYSGLVAAAVDAERAAAAAAVGGGVRGGQKRPRSPGRVSAAPVDDACAGGEWQRRSRPTPAAVGDIVSAGASGHKDGGAAVGGTPPPAAPSVRAPTAPTLPPTLANTVRDTVGAVVVDATGRLAAAASSGGAWLRPAGRLGAAAVPGAAAGVDPAGAAAAVASGIGERLVGGATAATLARALGGGAHWRPPQRPRLVRGGGHPPTRAAGTAAAPAAMKGVTPSTRRRWCACPQSPAGGGCWRSGLVGGRRGGHLGARDTELRGRPLGARGERATGRGRVAAAAGGDRGGGGWRPSPALAAWGDSYC